VYRGLTVSTVLHSSILAWALVSFGATPPLKTPDPEPVEVALISPDELVRLRQGDRNAKILEAAPETKPQPEVAKQEAPKPKPPPPAPPPAAEPPPPPEPKAAEPPKDPIADKIAALPPEAPQAAPPPPPPEPDRIALQIAAEEARRKAEEAQRAKAEAEAKAKARAEAEAKRKKELAEKKRREEAERKRREAEAKAKQFDADRIAALIDKSPEKRGAPPAAPANPAPAAKAKGPTAGAPEGRDTRLTASQASMIGVMMRQAVSRCWNINAGADGIDKIVVDVNVRLKPDGYLDGEPRLAGSGSGALYASAAASALRALKQCEPYELPKELYRGGWDHMVVTFDPSKMFR
jgi:colicin import membrane protein